MSLYEQLGFGTINKFIFDDIQALAEEYTEVWVEEAFKEANDQGVRNLKYLRGILKNWKTKGFKAEKAKSNNYDKKIAPGFNNFEPREYDYDNLEKRLLGWED